MGLEFTNFARLSGQQDPETLLSLPFHHWVFMWALGIWIQFLLLSWQLLYWVGYILTSLVSFSEWDDLSAVHRESLSQNNNKNNNHHHHHQNPNVIHLSYSVFWLSNLRGYIGSLLLLHASLWRFIIIFSIFFFFFCGLRCGPNQEAENRWPMWAYPE